MSQGGAFQTRSNIAKACVGSTAKACELCSRYNKAALWLGANRFSDGWIWEDMGCKTKRNEG